MFNTFVHFFPKRAIKTSVLMVLGDILRLETFH